MNNNFFGESVYKLIQSICQHISFGVYEKLLDNKIDDIRVVSIMGP